MFYCCILSYFYPRILFYRLYIYICLLFLFVVVSCFEFCFEFYCFCLFLLVSFFTLLGPFANPIFKPKNQKPNAHVQTNTALVRPTPCCTARQLAKQQQANWPFLFFYLAGEPHMPCTALACSFASFVHKQTIRPSTTQSDLPGNHVTGSPACNFLLLFTPVQQALPSLLPCMPAHHGRPM